MARVLCTGGIVVFALLLAGCESDPSIVDTPQLAMSIAAEQCGNEFHLGQPAEAHSSGDDWVVSWPSSTGHSAYTVSVDSEWGVPMGCSAASS